MIDARILADLQALIRSAKSPHIEASPDVKLPPLAVDQKVDVRVVARLPDARAEVLLGDQRVNINLPQRYAVGDTVSLTVVATTPRLQFALTSPPATGGTPQPTLSSEAQLLAAARDAVLSTGAKTSVLPPTPGSPISNEPPHAGSDLAAPLRQAIVQSGYFYEAHQEQWVAGARSLDALRQEPQNRVSPAASVENTPVGGPQVSTLDDAAVSAPATAASPVERLAAPHTHAVVAQQLNILEGQPIVWQGEVWPGQKMRWEIEADAQPMEVAAAAPVWRTTVDVDLPRLGAVHAILSLSATSLTLRIDALPGTLADLAAAQGELRQRMANAGLNLGVPTLVERG